MKKPTKAIIAAAGFGTRFLPQTKAMPKEMLPLIDKPIIQYVVEELVEAGIRDIIIIGSANKRAIEDHFDTPNEELLANLRAGGAKKQPLIDVVNSLSEMANFVYIRQKGPYGNATPLTCAAHLINRDEPVIYTFADDFIAASPSRFRQMISAADKLDGAVLSCKKITDDAEFDRYGVVNGQQVEDGVIKMTNIVEKPGKANAPSDLASVSSYLLPGEFFNYLEQGRSDFDGHGEFTIQPIMQRMIDDGHNFYGVEITNGTYYDTGDKLEYIKTVIDFGLNHQTLGPALKQFLQTRLNSEK
ncbi:MAG: NTP transferase domain-containing protein [Candidatus Nanogingivalaceae bacterium]|jgi:nucleotidyl transferase|nr:NTP transferase domain-containing protein [Candidatus Nanogingivalaceae bacterium]